MVNTSIHPRGNGDKFDYMFLNRLQLDCKYFLGFGARSPEVLWAKNVELQILIMKEFFNSFKGDQIPEWIAMKDIEFYESEMMKDI